MELESGYAFLDATLKAAVGLDGISIHEDEAPGKQAYPFIVISLEDAEDVTGVNNQRAMVMATALVRVVGLATDMTRLETLAAAIDAALDGASGESDGRPVLVTRERPLRTGGMVGDVMYKNLGGWYHLEIGA